MDNHPTLIDWKRLEADLKIQAWESSPESLVHELAHAYDCIGAKAFNGVGSEKVVDRMVRAKYKTIAGLNRSEMRVSAVTFLVIQPLGYANLAMILRDMRSNMLLDDSVSKRPTSPAPRSLAAMNDSAFIAATDLAFLKLIRTPRIIAMAKRINKFITEGYAIGQAVENP